LAWGTKGWYAVEVVEEDWGAKELAWVVEEGGDAMEVVAEDWGAKELAWVVEEVIEEDFEFQSIKHALEVRSTLATANYHKFFELFLKAPNMGAYLMDHFIERERIAALTVLCKAFRPNLDLEFVRSELAFNDIEECKEFLNTHNAAPFINPNNTLNTKDAYRSIEASGKKFEKVDIKGQIWWNDTFFFFVINI